MALLVLAFVTFVAVCAVCTAALLALTGWARFRKFMNRPFAPAYPAIEAPLWHVAVRHAVELLSTLLWLIQYPSFTEVWMALCLVPFLFVGFPLILNNMLEWGAYLLLGNSQGDGSHKGPNGDPSFTNGAPRIRCQTTFSIFLQDIWAAVKTAFNSTTTWFRMMICGKTPEGFVNWNNTLLCYIQKESWTGAMHHLDNDVLAAFPTTEPNSRANAVMMARCTTMAYDRWHNIDQAVSLRWNQQSAASKYSLLQAWSFDELIPAHQVDHDTTQQADITQQANPTPPRATARHGGTKQSVFGVRKQKKFVRDYTSVNTDAFLMKVEKSASEPGAVGEVALVLAFRGTEALQTVDWISDLANVNPPSDALDPNHYPLGFTHQGFRDCLGLKRDLKPADGLRHGGVDFGKSSYLYYTPTTRSASSPDWRIGDLKRRPPSDNNQHNNSAATTGTQQSTTSTTQTTATTAGSSRSVSDLRQSTTVTDQSIGTSDLPGSSQSSSSQPGGVENERSPYAVITRAIKEALDSSAPESTTVKIFVTGHSLGGALAHLYTGALLLDESNADVAKHIEAVYTLGEPRVGSQTWVTLVEEALRQIPPKHDQVPHIKAEDRFKRVVNTLDIITRIPPPLDEIYQHPGHCTFIKADFLTAYIPDEQGRTSSSPVTNLIETPDIFLWPTVITVGLKLLISVLLLFSRTTPSRRQVDTVVRWYKAVTCSIAMVWIVPVVFLVAAALFWVLFAVACVMFVAAGVVIWLLSLSSTVSGLPVFKSMRSFYTASALVVQVAQQPELAKNPLHMIARLTALLGPVLAFMTPLLLLDTLLVLVMLFIPILWPVVFADIIAELAVLSLLVSLGLFLPPFIFSGIVDHSMAEYYTACWLTNEADWKV